MAKVKWVEVELVRTYVHAKCFLKIEKQIKYRRFEGSRAKVSENYRVIITQVKLDFRTKEPYDSRKPIWSSGWKDTASFLDNLMTAHSIAKEIEDGTFRKRKYYPRSEGKNANNG